MVPLNGHIEQATGRYLIGDYVQYGCNQGYLMDGGSIQSGVVTCQSDGTWSSPQPICK